MSSVMILSFSFCSFRATAPRCTFKDTAFFLMAQALASKNGLEATVPGNRPKSLYYIEMFLVTCFLRDGMLILHAFIT